MPEWITTGINGEPIDCITQLERPIISRVRASTKITRQFLLDLHREVLQGVSPITALTMLGIARSTAAMWLKSSDKKCQAIRDVIEHAQAHAVASAEKRVHSAKPLEWLKGSPSRSIFEWDDIEEQKPVTVTAYQQTNNTSNYNLKLLSDSDLDMLDRIVNQALTTGENPPSKGLTDGGK